MEMKSMPKKEKPMMPTKKMMMEKKEMAKMMVDKMFGKKKSHGK